MTCSGTTPAVPPRSSHMCLAAEWWSRLQICFFPLSWFQQHQQQLLWQGFQGLLHSQQQQRHLQELSHIGLQQTCCQPTRTHSSRPSCSNSSSRSGLTHSLPLSRLNSPRHEHVQMPLHSTRPVAFPVRAAGVRRIRSCSAQPRRRACLARHHRQVKQQQRQRP